MRRKTPYFLPPSTKAALPYDNIPSCQLYTYVAFSLRQPWCPLPPRPAGTRLCRPHHRATHLFQGSRPPAPPEGLAEHHVFGRNRGRAQTPPTGRTGRVKEGQIWVPKSLPQKPGGLGLPVFGDGPLEADWPVCRGLIIPGGSASVERAATGTKGRSLPAITRAGTGIPGTGIGPPQDRPGAAHPRQRI